MDPPKRILIVEDDVDIANVLSLHLRDERYEVVHSADGNEGLRLLEQGGWDALILDLMLPGVDGLEICRRARAMTRYTPIIITSARSSEVHRILGLELGADDYLAKPFSVLELVARVKALLRRVEAMAKDSRIDAGSLQIAGLTIDPLTREATVDGKPIELTPREFDLLYFFAQHPGKVFSRMDLLNAVWGYQHEGYEHTVNTHINRLRAKIEADPAQPERILTVWGHGYKLAVPGIQATGPRPPAHRRTRREPDANPAALDRLFGAVAGVLRRVRVAADPLERPARKGSRAGPVARPRRPYRAAHDADGRERPAARRRAATVRPVDGGESERRGLSARQRGAHRGRRRAGWAVKREQVDLAPIRHFIAGDALPILGDDPRSIDGRKCSAPRRCKWTGSRLGGISTWCCWARRTTRSRRAWPPARCCAPRSGRWRWWRCWACAGLMAFGLITRPLRRLTEAMRRFDADGEPDTQPAVPRSSPAGRRDEIAVLEATFAQMANRIGEQWRALRGRISSGAN